MEYDENLITPNTEMQEAALRRHSSYNNDDIDRDRINEESQLSEMGFNKNIIRKVYLILKPRNIEQAIEYMSEQNNIIQHEFYKGSFSDTKQCFICGFPKQNHIRGSEEEEEDDPIINRNNNEQPCQKSSIIIKVNEGKPCGVCDSDLTEEDMKYDTLECHHTSCLNCWFEYIKGLIIDAKVSEIKCFTYGCPTILNENFILSIISTDKKLVQKYRNFKQKAEILKCPTKKFCPEPDCQSFIEKKEGEDKYVQCELGHKYCYECLKPWHGKSKCEEKLDKDFQVWKKGKVIKQCPRCKLYTEKNEGCNHMTCAECKYMWCWLCLGEYTNDHYKKGICNGLQFYKGNSVPKPSERKPVVHRDYYFDEDDEARERLRNEPKAIFRKVTRETYNTISLDSFIFLEEFFEDVRDLKFIKRNKGCLGLIIAFFDLVFLLVPHALIALYKETTENEVAWRGFTNIVVLITAFLLWIPFQLYFTSLILAWSVLLFWWPKQNPMYNLYTASFKSRITLFGL